MKKEKLEILYSLGVIIAVPALVVLNTVLLVRSTRSAFNAELRRKADLINAVIAESSKSDIAAKRYDSLGQALNALEKAQPAITGIQVIEERDRQLGVVARTTSAAKKLDPSSELQAKIAYDRKLPIAKLINVTRDGKTAQAWNVATPALDASDNVVAVVSSDILTTDAQEAIDKAFTMSFFVLIGSLTVIVALLFRHFRLLGNVELLARQREINQTMSDFLSVATHELRAPASIIKGYISNVMDGTFGPVNKQINDQLQVAVDQTERLNTLVQDLLNVSRIEQGRIAYTLTPVDSTKVLRTIVEHYTTLAADKGLKLELTEPAVPVPNIKADEGRVQEIFTNLIDNAIKYTAKGSVTVSQRVEKRMVVITVKDTGFGMSSEARRRLFQRFYRIQTDQTQGISGTGLGLWIIKQYIQAMHGSIVVESMEQVGSEFIVALPISEQA